MKNLARFVVSAIALGVAVAASAKVEINDESTRTLHRALIEPNRPKAIALLRGLLPSRVRIAVNADPKLSKAVFRGAEAWNEALAEPIFEPVTSDERADVVVGFVRQVNHRLDEQGQLKVKRSFQWHDSAGRVAISAALDIRSIVDQRPISPEAASLVTAHELGHLLGLDDDRDGTGVMADFDPARTNVMPTAREVQAVSAFRDRVRALLDKWSAADY